MRKLKTCVYGLLFTIFAITCSSENQIIKMGKTQTGVLTYPAEDNIDFKEGTLECWLKCAFDPTEYLTVKSKFFGLLNVVSFAGDKGGMNVNYFIRNNAGPFLAGSLSPQKIMKPFFIGKYVFKKDQWYHLAVVWKGKRMWSYIDGKKKGEVSQNDFFHLAFGPINSQQIRFGDKWLRRGLMVIDDLRISTIARNQQELGFFKGELKPDIHTCLLDPFEKTVQDKKNQLTLPIIMFNGKNGKISNSCQLIEQGKFGKALSFFKQ